ncbi:Transcriptional regulator, AcrR family, partial [hydrothermal vent metagenome]
VKAILEAATCLLSTNGMKHFTTNHIANLAGVSIGSLYQYFPNKESILAKLIELHKEKEFKRVSAIMTRLQENPTCQNSRLEREGNVRLAVKEFINIHAENLELSRILNAQTRELACLLPFRSTTTFLTKLLHSLLDKVDSASRKENYIRAYIIANSVDSLIQTTLLEQPQLLTEARFLDELVNLSIGYLQPR